MLAFILMNTHFSLIAGTLPIQLISSFLFSVMIPFFLMINFKCFPSSEEPYNNLRDCDIKSMGNQTLNLYPGVQKYRVKF